MKTNNSNVYVYISYMAMQVNNVFLHFVKNCGYRVLTCEKQVLDYCTKNDIYTIYLPEKPSDFKRALKKIDISFLVLAGDTYSGRMYYMARRYHSGFTQSQSFNTVEFWGKRMLWKQNLFYLWVYRILGLTGKLFDKHIIMHEESILGVFHAVVNKIVWGLESKSFLHGSYSNLLFLQGEWEKKVFVKNGIDKKNIRVTGSIQADSMICDLKQNLNKIPALFESCDLLLFSQPLYKYSGEPYYLEELEIIVNKCYQMGLELCIKLHPRDDISIFRPFTQGKCRLIQHHRDWKEKESIGLIQSTKVVMGKGSTALMLPLLMKKPVITMDLFNSDASTFKYHFDFKLFLKDIKDFEYLYTFATDPKKQPFIQDQQNQFLSRLGYYDGLSWKRIKNEIEQYLKNSEMDVY